MDIPPCGSFDAILSAERWIVKGFALAEPGMVGYTVRKKRR
jgi:hypothetical protein